MASTHNVPELVQWLSNNALWDNQNLCLKESKFGGVGVFANKDLDPEREDDSLLLRIPKKSILSGKTSSISNLLFDHDITSVNGLILSFIYEASLGEKSPWYDYINSIKIYNDKEVFVKAICNWTAEEKELLHNTEVDLSNMLDSSELRGMYEQSMEFAVEIADVFPIPDILFNSSEDNFQRYAAIVQSICSRSFEIDPYHEIALVPGADLFNHGPQENIHFTCEGDTCGDCGQLDCENNEHGSEGDWTDSDEDDELLEEIESGSEEENEGEEDEDEDEESMTEELEDEEDQHGHSHSHGAGVDHGHSHGHSHSHGEPCGHDHDGGSSDEEEEEEPLTEITLAYIEQMEEELEAERLAEEAESDEEMEENEAMNEEDDDEDEEEDIDEDDIDPEFLELASTPAEECCDLLLVRPVKADEEVFNTYGDLPNSYLLQRYGFIIPGNEHDYVSLSLSVFQSAKDKASKSKLKWWEELGYDLVNEIIAINSPKGCDDDECGGCEEDEEDEPESWELSPRLEFNGEPTKQTYALARLLSLPQPEFLKLAKSPRSKLESRVQVLFQEDKKAFKMVSDWCSFRVNRYKDGGLSSKDYSKIIKKQVDHKKIISQMIQGEKAILERGLKYVRARS